MYKHSRDLEKDAVFGDQMKELIKLIGRMEDKFDTKSTSIARSSTTKYGQMCVLGYMVIKIL